jgi:hypothetical protein
MGVTLQSCIGSTFTCTECTTRKVQSEVSRTDHCQVPQARCHALAVQAAVVLTIHASAI